MTKTEIKAALDLAGISYKAKATLEQLQALHATMLEATDPKRTPDGNVDLSKPDLPAVPAVVDDFTMSDEELAGQQGRVKAEDDVVVEPTPAEAPAAPQPESTASIGTGLKIEKDRVEQNGIKRPSIGGKCRAIWDALDEYRAETGELPTSKTVRELAADSGWNPNNASIEYYQWRKFNGIAKG